MDTSTPLERVRPKAHRRYRQLPVFGHLLDDLVAWSVRNGYRMDSIYLLLDAVRHLEGWLRRKRLRSVAELTDDDLSAAYQCLRSRRSDPRYAWPLRAVRRFLHERQLLRPGRTVSLTATEREVERWADHLLAVRGLAPGTIEWSRRHVMRFLSFIGFDRDCDALQGLSVREVEAFLCHISRRLGRTTMQQVVAAIRGFLQLQFLRGSLGQPLHHQIDTVRVFDEEQLPVPIAWIHLRQLLGRMDRSTPMGRRDYAVLLLAATYGLRASDVAALTFDAIDWRSRVIRIVQCKTRQPLVLPLTDEVGEAVADYMRQARPPSAPPRFRQIFLRHTAPIGPLSLPAMSNTLRHAAASACITLPAAGFRCLRHALAMRLLRRNTSLKAISDVLGHRSPESTSQYLRLHVDDLRPVALPLPIAAVRSSRPSQTAPAAVSPVRVRPLAGARVAPRGWQWRSPLATSMQDYLRVRRALGRIYETPERTLRGLDYFLVCRFPRARRLSSKIFTAWATGLESLNPTTARMRMLCVRKFCIYLVRSEPTAFVPDPTVFPREQPHLVPHILSPRDVAHVLAETTVLRRTRANPLHPWTYRIAFLLMYCCGLRVGETLRLVLADIEPKSMVLTIRESKFNKSRMVPLSPSLGRELRDYLRARRRTGMPSEPSTPLVWNGYLSRSDALTPSPVCTTWWRLCRLAGVLDGRGRAPRLHDLRHSFAVEALRRGYRAGQEPRVVLPRIARYMGHAGAQFTHYYLKFTEPLRQAAGDRFRNHFAPALTASAITKNGGGR